MERDQVLAFRLARQGLDRRRPLSLAEAARCPASDYAPGAALLALAARADGVSRAAFDEAADTGELAVGPSLRAAIHAVAPEDHALYGRALVAHDDLELAEQLGPGARRHLAEAAVAPGEALGEVTEATRAALAGGVALDKNALHAALRARVRPALLPWCRGCDSHHVSPMLWRYALVRTGARCDARRRYLVAEPGGAAGGRAEPGGAARAAGPPEPAEAARRFLRFYAPAGPAELAAWAGLARAHARRLWSEIEGELAEVRVDGRRAWALREDEEALGSPPAARGLRLLPPRDPYLAAPDRATLAPDPEVRRRLFKAAGGPGAVLQDGRLAGLWRSRARGARLAIDVEALGPLDRGALEAEAARVAEVRGLAGPVVLALAVG